MPAYAYKAIDSQGKEQSGMIEADSPRAARTALRARALLPMQVEAATEQPKHGAHWLQRDLWAARAYNPAGLAIFTRQLAGLVAAGLPIERALTVMTEEAENPRQQRVIALRQGELVFDGPTSALTPAFLRDLYGTAADELIDEPVPSSTPPSVRSEPLGLHVQPELFPEARAA
jgi:general secretion pathway protein F